MQRWMIVSLAVAGVGLASAPARAQCGALCLYENGSSDLGRAAAGAGARAEDASTALWNPAGMTELEGHEIQLGLIASFGDLDPSLNAGTTPPVVSGGNASGFGALFGGSFTTELPYGIHFGMASTVLYGGVVDYDSDWTGRNYVTDASLFSFLIQPSFAYAVTDWLSLGAGPAILYTTFTERVKAPFGDEPTIKIDAADSWDAGGVFSALVKPVEGTRIGIYYRTEIEADTKGKVEGPAAANPHLDTDFHFPQGVNVSVYHQLSDAWALLGDGGWTEWSRFGNIPLQLDFPMGSVMGRQRRGWNDTWRLAAGAQYRYSEQLTLQGGFGYDSSPVKSKRLLPDIPASAQYRFSLGAQLRPRDYLELSLSYQFLWFEGLSFNQVALPPTDAVVLNGDYDPAFANQVGVNVLVRF